MKNLFLKAKFTHDVGNGTAYACFEYDYIKKVIKYVGGNLKIFLKSSIDAYGYSWDKDGKVFINEFSIKYILKQIDYFKKNGKWYSA